VNDNITRLAEELTEKGCTVYLPKGDRYKTFFVAVKGENHICLEWQEVPYRWQTYRQLVPSREHGSSASMKEMDGTLDPWSAESLLEAMVPYPFPGRDKEKLHYLEPLKN